MATFTTGNHLNRFVKPQLIYDLQNHEDTFTGFLGKVNKSAATAEGVSINKLINDIQVKTGLTTSGVLTPRKLNGQKGVIPWMPFTTETLYFDKEELRALAFDKKSEGRKLLKEAVLNALLQHTLHAIAPTSHVANKKPVIATSGADDGTGRKMLVPADILKLLRQTDIKNPVCVLNKNHLIDLQAHEESKSRFRELIMDERNLKPVPYAGVKFAASDIDILYDNSGAKKALGATPIATDSTASVFIDKSNTIYYLNDLFFTMTSMENDTRNEIPRTEIRIYGEFIGAVIEDDRKQAALIDGKV
ncbi:MAG: hypothetical protein N4A35_05385 [Flavobacteriales bacterium]|jgi:hypothetical protein|nr:hypothetical protein [Flavobacteriales bacterium]